MDDSIYQEMHRVELTHWWFSAKRRIVSHLLHKFAGDPARGKVEICDIGCGCGAMLADLQSQGYACRGIDASDVAISFCKSRGVVVTKGSLPDGLDVAPGSMDAVLLLDVLEHVAEDRQSVAAAFGLLRPGGVLIATVPAHQWLWTMRDKYHHHLRRYSRRQFRSLLASAPQGEIALLSYMNSILFPLAVVDRIASKVRPPQSAGNDCSIPPGFVNRPLQWAFAAERYPLGLGIRLPWGLSLVGVLRKA